MRPLPPAIISVQNAGIGLINISWTATTVVGVDQHYTVNYGMNTSRIDTAQLHFTFNQSMSKAACYLFIVFVTAVNGAGESDPSNNVTFVLPSLPDIVPVTASLTHQVWKSGGETIVKVMFEVDQSFSV